MGLWHTFERNVKRGTFRDGTSARALLMVFLVFMFAAALMIVEIVRHLVQTPDYRDFGADTFSAIVSWMLAVIFGNRLFLDEEEPVADMARGKQTKPAHRKVVPDGQTRPRQGWMARLLREESTFRWASALPRGLRFIALQMVVVLSLATAISLAIWLAGVK